jgi:inosine-uridine nucleoside N-ribohydrolase
MQTSTTSSNSTRLTANAIQVPEVIIQGDFGKDLDDEVALLVATWLHKEKKIKITSVITNLFPTLERARLVCGQLSETIKSQHIPVYRGADVGLDNIKVSPYEFTTEYDKSTYPEFIDLTAMNFNTYYGQFGYKPSPQTILINSAMTDLYRFLNWYYDPLLHPIDRVIMQGGWQKNSKGEVVPNSAANNNFDIEAARACFELLQRYKIPLFIAPRELAYQNPVPASLYAEICAHKVGSKLYNAHSKALEHLYRRCLLAPDSPLREGLPGDRDGKWFFEFIAKKPVPEVLPPVEGVAENVDKVNSYDVFTVLYAAFPELFNIVQVAETVWEIQEQGVDYAQLICSIVKNSLGFSD